MLHPCFCVPLPGQRQRQQPREEAAIFRQDSAGVAVQVPGPAAGAGERPEGGARLLGRAVPRESAVRGGPGQHRGSAPREQELGRGDPRPHRAADRRRTQHSRGGEVPQEARAREGGTPGCPRRG